MDISKLDQVNLRDVWPKKTFTSWLGENLQQLGEALSIPLELQGQEQWMGVFKADILARHTETDELVLIAIQLEKTDLGQVITYVAGLEASTVVWIAERFTVEYLAAIDWLNRNTTDFQFFAVQVSAWRIGDSAMAPRFEVVARPNSWVQAAARQRAQEKKRVRVSDEAVVAYVSEHPDLKRTEVATQLGISERKVYGALARHRAATDPSSEEEQ